MNIRRYSVAAAAVLALSLPMTTSAVFAQTAAPQTQQTTPPTPEAPATVQQDFSDDILRSFAVAFLEVDQINRTYTPQLQQATTPEEQQQIQEQASAEMVEAVEGSEGISVQEYTSIMQAAQANPELAQKLTEYIGEASSGAPAPDGGTAAPEAAPATPQ